MLKKLKQLVWGRHQYLAMFLSAMIFSGVLNVAQAMDLRSISQLIFFGDSLTDSGFNDLWPISGAPPLPAGKQPTWTTYGGYIWSQYLARDIKGFQLPVYPGPNPPDLITNNAIYPVPTYASGTLTGINYAAGGSTTNSTGFIETWAPSLHQQVAFYLSSIPAGQMLDPNAVYFIWEGANDLLTALTTVPTPSLLELLIVAQTAAINIGNEVALLSSRGAKRIVVMSMPNLGLAPFAGSDPAQQASLKNLTFTFNSMLNTQLGVVIQQYGTKILYVDTYTLLENVINATKAGQSYVVAGQSFTFVNYNGEACAGAFSAIGCPSGTPSGYIFADALHPTNEAHRVISLTVETLMQQWA